MANKTDATYAGAIIMEINGREAVELISVDTKTTIGRKPVKTMNRRGRVRGYADGITEFELNVTAAVPIDDTEIDWANITKAKITLYPINAEEKRTSYLDCFSVSCSSKYEVDNEARIDIQMIALDKVEE
ncbi:phage tail protein [Snodgrassella alvi]|uniref:phage tail protein n=1 Tax=Snodgrassella alvi TaxID=1196083 RepID=UPI00351C478C